MKQIRRNIFETNSSSSHSIVLTNDDLDKSREPVVHGISLLGVEKDISFLPIVQQKCDSFWECKFWCDHHFDTI